MSPFNKSLKLFIVAATLILQGAHSEDLFSDNLARDYKPVATLPNDATMGGYPIFQGGRTWRVISGNSTDNNVRIKLGHLYLISPIGGDYFAEMVLTTSLSQGRSYFIDEPCKGPHLVENERGGGRFDDCMTIDPYVVKIQGKDITTLLIGVRNSREGARLYDLRLLLNLDKLGFPGTGIPDWTGEAVKQDQAKTRLIENVSAWAKLLQEGVGKANDYGKPIDAFAKVPPIIELLENLGKAIDQATADTTLYDNAIQQLQKHSVVKDCDVCPGLVAIPEGHFEMGSNAGDKDSKPVHEVDIKGFFLGQTEVTFGQWKALMGEGSQSLSLCGDDCPVSRVSWNDAQIYVKKLSERTGKNYRLPSEAEWEYAAQAGGTAKWSLGDDERQLDRLAWYGVNSFGTTHVGGRKQANAFGLLDMYGNVWEWVQDVWHPNYDGAPIDGAAWMNGGDEELRVLRGGAWFDKSTSLQTFYRSWNTSVIHYYGAGLRVARNRD